MRIANPLFLLLLLPAGVAIGYCTAVFSLNNWTIGLVVDIHRWLLAIPVAVLSIAAARYVFRTEKLAEQRAETKFQDRIEILKTADEKLEKKRNKLIAAEKRVQRDLTRYRDERCDELQRHQRVTVALEKKLDELTELFAVREKLDATIAALEKAAEQGGKPNKEVQGRAKREAKRLYQSIERAEKLKQEIGHELSSNSGYYK